MAAALQALGFEVGTLIDANWEQTNNTVYGFGQALAAGGIVFFDKGRYSDGRRYLEAWTADEPGSYHWKSSSTSTGGTSTEIGSGSAWLQGFSGGFLGPGATRGSIRVRAIRAF